MLFEQVPNRHDSPRSESRACKILVVDDNTEFLTVLKLILEKHGYQVCAVERVGLAIEHLMTDVPDLIVCDVLIPDKNGFDFHAELQRHPIWCSIPFVFLTALSSEADIRAGKTLGVDDYLTKPFDPDDLLAVIRGKLASAMHRREMAAKQWEGYTRRIIHTLSHEFRTPLVSINTGSELLLEQRKDLGDEQVARLLKSIWRGGQRLERLVDDFMLLQQIDLGHAQHVHQLYRRSYNLCHIVETAIDCFTEVYADVGYSAVQFNAPADDVRAAAAVLVYDVQIINVIHRLLHNAFKFGGQREPVVVSVGVAEGRAYVAIRDHGPGLDNFPHSARVACQPFVQINRETYEQQGCGLGLTISMYFTQINGGNITLRQPDSGPGLEAIVDFPLPGSG